MNRIPIFLLVLIIAAWNLEAAAQPADVNVLQDCWTTDLQQDSDPERELYSFTTDDPISFVWKHKILENCSSYRFSIHATQCTEGKPRVGPIAFEAINISVGPVNADPADPEPLFSYTATPGSIPPGSYDWMLLVECNDTNGTIRSPGPKVDGDIDDQCGINVGLNPPAGLFPVLFGPDPLQVMDPDPGGAPPGRVPGESGTTRPWCFDVVQAPRTIFVSSQTYPNGNFGGLSGADAACQTLADNEGLGGTYKAWMSDSNTDAKDRMTQSPGPYQLVDGTPIAPSFADLIDCPFPYGLCGNSLDNPINVDEKGNTVGGVNFVFTGTLPDGTDDGQFNSCNNWTTTLGSAYAGRTDRVNFGWTALASATCNTGGLRLYCVEQ